MSSIAVALVLLLASYLVGAIPFGYLVGRAKGIDLFKSGSGNIGATNVGRLLGRKYGILVFVLDFLKGAIPVAAITPLAQAIHPDTQSVFGPVEALPVGAALAAFLGHLFPVYLGFRGGKGVATGAGAVAVLVPIPTAFALLAWAVVALTTRYVSLASIVAAVVLVLARIAVAPDLLAPGWLVTAFCFAAVGLVVVKHRGNIRRLWAGTENTIGDGLMRQTLLRGLHIVALGLWFGGAAFFNFVAAPTVFDSFKTVVNESPSDRTANFQILPDEITKGKEEEKAAKKKDLASALAGSAVGPIFPKYFLMQAVCGLVALVTAATWYRHGPLHRWRAYLLAFTVILVVMSWPLSNYVSELRVARFAADSSVANAAKAAFVPWHLVSLLLSFLTTCLAGVALAMAARLPDEPNQA